MYQCWHETTISTTRNTDKEPTNHVAYRLLHCNSVKIWHKYVLSVQECKKVESDQKYWYSERNVQWKKLLRKSNNKLNTKVMDNWVTFSSTKRLGFDFLFATI